MQLPAVDRTGYLGALFVEARDAIVVVDDERRCVDVNPAGCALLRVPPEAVLDRRLDDLVADAEVEVELREAGTAASGRRLILLQEPQPEEDASLSRRVAHELNNHLAVVSTQSELLLGGLEDAALRHRVEEIKEAARQSATLTRELLTLEPRAVGARPVEAAPVETAAPAPTQAGSERILLLDDQQAVRDLVAEILRRKGYDVAVAEDPSDALARVVNAPGSFDLLVTDMVMPEMSGSELARRVVAISPLTKVLFVSGYAPQFLAENGGIGDEAYLQKPFMSETLLQKVRSVLDRPAAAA